MYSESLNQGVIRAYLIKQKLEKIQNEYILNKYSEKFEKREDDRVWFIVTILKIVGV